jgi:hypothetical protein
VILVIIFGPVFCLIYIGAKPKKRNKLREAYTGFLDISAQFTIPVAIASIVRLKQSAPFYEITFLDSPLTMEFLGLLCTIVTGVCIMTVEKPDKEEATSYADSPTVPEEATTSGALEAVPQGIGQRSE